MTGLSSLGSLETVVLLMSVGREIVKEVECRTGEEESGGGGGGSGGGDGITDNGG